jgi:UDP-N-acetylmuramoyl-tripeptide--D-alanyl-D-alanine ligase
MLELGGHTVRLHEDVGRQLARMGVDVLLTVGGTPAAAMAKAAVTAGLAREYVRHFPESEEAAAAAAGIVRPGDLVLVKGSRGIRTDRIVERLKADGLGRS